MAAEAPLECHAEMGACAKHNCCLWLHGTFCDPWPLRRCIQSLIGDHYEEKKEGRTRPQQDKSWQTNSEACNATCETALGEWSYLFLRRLPCPESLSVACVIVVLMSFGCIVEYLSWKNIIYLNAHMQSAVVMRNRNSY